MRGWSPDRSCRTVVLFVGEPQDESACAISVLVQGAVAASCPEWSRPAGDRQYLVGGGAFTKENVIVPRLLSWRRDDGQPDRIR